MKIIQSRSLRATVLGALLFSSSGCSFTFVKPPSSNGRIAGPRRACTTSKLAPVFDTIFTGAQLVRTAMALSASDSVYEDPAQPLSRGADVGLGVGFAALFLSSAIYGYANTSACSKLREGPSDADDDLSPEKWTTTPTRQQSGAAAEQPPAPADQPVGSSAPADASPTTETPPAEGTAESSPTGP